MRSTYNKNKNSISNMKLLIVPTAVLLLALFSAPKASAQIGGVAKKPTAESINSDLFSGLDFFAKAAVHYAAAVLPTQKAMEYRAKLEASTKEKQSSAIAEFSGELTVIANRMREEMQSLSQEALESINKGDAEFKKGLAKWAVVGGAIALAAKQGGQDAALATAIPIAQEMLKDLPAIKGMGDAMSDLRKAQEGQEDPEGRKGKKGKKGKKGQ
jgi:hypothetical protein